MKKNLRIWIYLLVVIGAFLMLESSCTKSGDPTAPVPVLTTSEVTNITSSTASSGGIVISDGGSTITARGVCWSTGTTPTIADSKTTDGSGTGTFLSSLTGLTGGINGTMYYVRAYATTNVGTGYGSAMSFTTKPGGSAGTVPGGSAGTVKDINGNTYNTIIIGSQVWMVENLKTTKYRDGSPIPNVTDNNEWGNLTTGAQCNYNNNVANGTKYGKLYNWYAVNDSRNIAPTGWHVASDAEWDTLKTYVTANRGTFGSVAKALASTTDWASSTAAGAIGNDLTKNNTTGFTALPGGNRYLNGNYSNVGNYGGWWSSAEDSTSGAWIRYVYYSNSKMYRSYVKEGGFSVRCVKD
jgi:uncharacterized protein (TIGR02145 family)